MTAKLTLKKIGCAGKSSVSEYNQLWKIIEANDFETLASLLDEGLDINIVRSDVKTNMLHHAIAWAGPETFSLLLERGIGITNTDLSSWNPLLKVIDMLGLGNENARDEELADLAYALIQKGCDPFQPNPNYTPDAPQSHPRARFDHALSEFTDNQHVIAILDKISDSAVILDLSLFEYGLSHGGKMYNAMVEQKLLLKDAAALLLNEPKSEPRKRKF